jgi:predicted AAA+ superfamily ATPase
VIERYARLTELQERLERSPVVALLGPRQCGKTTLARQLLDPKSNQYFDLEEPISLARLEQPQLTLAPLKGLVVIDEVQRRPDLFQVLRVLVDRPRNRARFLILGSASATLLRQASESLAGRIELVEMSGFTLDEIGIDALARVWRRGSFPRSYLARSEAASAEWRRQFTRAVVERDLPELGISIPAATLMRFWSMLAHNHGGVWKATDPARSLGLSEPTVRRYLDLFTGLFLVRQLQPWHQNLSKRQVKAPKVYLRDSGLLHSMLGITDEKALLSHPKLGASWEGFVIEALAHAHRPEDLYFWSTHQGAELDLLMFKRGKRVGFEVKRADAPTLTTSMRTVLDDLELDSLSVVYPGDREYTLAHNVRVVPVAAALNLPD